MILLHRMVAGYGGGRLGPPLQLDGNSLGEYDFFGRHLGNVGQGFDTGFDRFAQPAAVLSIDLVGWSEVAAITSLNDEDDGGAVALALEAHECLQMFGAPFADGVGKSRAAVDGEGDVFHFDEAVAAASFQTQVETRVGADFDFAANGWVAAQFCNHARLDRFWHESVRVHGIDADPAASDLDHFPGVSEFTVQIVAAGNVNRAAGLFAAHHAAGVGAVGGDDGAVFQTHIGEKSLVALDQRAADQTGLEAHGDFITEEAGESHRSAEKTSHGVEPVQSRRNRSHRLSLRLFLEQAKTLC